MLCVISSAVYLRGYPQWPDSTVVNKRWLDCRDRGYITGSTAHGFSITPKGLEVAEKTGSVLSGKRRHFSHRVPSKLTAEARTRAGRFIRSLEASDAYNQFQREGEIANISEFDFRSMLLCTMENSAATLNSNLEQFKQYAPLYERQDFVDFLEFCRRKFASVLSEKGSKSETYRGGMNRQKLR